MNDFKLLQPGQSGDPLLGAFHGVLGGKYPWDYAPGFADADGYIMSPGNSVVFVSPNKLMDSIFTQDFMNIYSLWRAYRLGYGFPDGKGLYDFTAGVREAFLSFSDSWERYYCFDIRFQRYLDKVINQSVKAMVKAMGAKVV